MERLKNWKYKNAIKDQQIKILKLYLKQLKFQVYKILTI